MPFCAPRPSETQAPPLKRSHECAITYHLPHPALQACLPILLAPCCLPGASGRAQCGRPPVALPAGRVLPHTPSTPCLSLHPFFRNTSNGTSLPFVETCDSVCFGKTLALASWQHSVDGRAGGGLLGCRKHQAFARRSAQLRPPALLVAHGKHPAGVKTGASKVLALHSATLRAFCTCSRA